jgi:hypothetical protein
MPKPSPACSKYASNICVRSCSVHPVADVVLLPLQVMGHAKTICVLIIGWALFGDSFTYRKFIGMAMAVLGMVIYGYFAGRKVAPKLDTKESGESEPLITTK